MPLERRLRWLRDRLDRIRADLRWVEGETWFYNLDNYREPAQVAAELTATAETFEPDDIGLVECIGNRLPEIPGYRLIRDDSTEARRNIACYVRNDNPVPWVRWVDLGGTWPRTKRGGIHPPRSYLTFGMGRMQKVVAHQPPKNAKNAWGLQLEGIAALVDVMAPWTRRRQWRQRPRVARRIARLRPRMLVWDANRVSGQPGPGPDMLARQIGGDIHGGQRIDQAATRGQIEVTSLRKLGQVGAVKLLSDHKGAIRIRWRVRAFWLNRKENR